MKPTLNLTLRHDVNGDQFFQVDTVKNTVLHLPGDIIEKRELARIIQDKRTNVNIKGGKL